MKNFLLTVKQPFNSMSKDGMSKDGRSHVAYARNTESGCKYSQPIAVENLLLIETSNVP